MAKLNQLAITIQYLTDEVVRSSLLIVEYKKRLKEFDNIYDVYTENYYKLFNEFEQENKVKNTSVQDIKDTLKKIRKLTFELEKEVTKNGKM